MPAFEMMLLVAKVEFVRKSVTVPAAEPFHVNVPAPGVMRRSVIVAPPLSVIVPVVASARAIVPAPVSVNVVVPNDRPLVTVSVFAVSTSTLTLLEGAQVVMVMLSLTSKMPAAVSIWTVDTIPASETVSVLSFTSIVVVNVLPVATWSVKLPAPAVMLTATGEVLKLTSRVAPSALTVTVTSPRTSSASTPAVVSCEPALFRVIVPFTASAPPPPEPVMVSVLAPTDTALLRVSTMVSAGVMFSAPVMVRVVTVVAALLSSVALAPPMLTVPANVAAADTVSVLLPTVSTLALTPPAIEPFTVSVALVLFVAKSMPALVSLPAMVNDPPAPIVIAPVPAANWIVFVVALN